MLIVTTDTIPGKKIKKVLGVVIGEPKPENDSLIEAFKGRSFDRIQKDIIREAEKVGGNAIVGFLFFSGGNNTSVRCYGTAVLIEDEATPLREETLVMQPDVDPNSDDTRVNKPA